MSTLRLGMIGLDTSHCGAFAELLHNSQNPHHVPGGRIVCAFPGGSDAFALSRNRVAQFTADMRDKYGVRIVDTITEAARDVDGIFLESVDGRQHLAQFKQVAKFGKPVFIDKPFTCSRKEAEKIARLALKRSAPVFSCSSLRYAQGVAECGAGKPVLGCTAFGTLSILEDFPGYFWYGIHSAEMLFAKMGCGVRSVQACSTDQAEIVTGTWHDGRVGTIYGTKFKGPGTFGCTVFTSDTTEQAVAGSNPPYYALMMPHILEFFRTGKAPVDIAETIEIAAFLEAANKSRAKGGKVVGIKI